MNLELKKLPEGGSMFSRMMRRCVQCEITTDHSASSYGIPVILVDGKVMDYEEIDTVYFHESSGEREAFERFAPKLSQFVKCKLRKVAQ